MQYQRDLKENELEKVFTDRASNVQNVDYSNMIISTVGDQMKQKQEGRNILCEIDKLKIYDKV